jgi:hypothetical protein
MRSIPSGLDTLAFPAVADLRDIHAAAPEAAASTGRTLHKLSVTCRTPNQKIL